MVLFVSCSSHNTSIPSSQSHCTSSDLSCEVSSILPPRKRSEPLPLRSPYSCDESTSPLERLSSPLSSSAESISSIKSSSSSRSSAEREVERAQRRQLLDSSLHKIRSVKDLPLRQHLLVFNTIKQLQRDLDLLDDEELYCSLVGGDDTERMEVDECRWLPTAPATIPSVIAPPQQEERHQQSPPPTTVTVAAPAAVVAESQDVNMYVAEPETWSWSTQSSMGMGLFESIQDVLGGSGWRWATPTSNLWSDSGSGSLWGHLDDLSADPLGGATMSSFELQHLFPSQVLLQA